MIARDFLPIPVQSLPDVRATCRTVPGLARDQLELCYRASDVTAAAIEGLELGVRECQYQFQWHRWNCSSLSTKSRNPHTSNMLKRGKQLRTTKLIIVFFSGWDKSNAHDAR
uniref:Protein Wnt n=1 Tax=Anopheles christyi TaxID=43041 RepID=A0A182K4F5_9DIPT